MRCGDDGGCDAVVLVMIVRESKYSCQASEHRRKDTPMIYRCGAIGPIRHDLQKSMNVESIIVLVLHCIYSVLLLFVVPFHVHHVPLTAV